jgi:hypothetical protein
MKIIAKIQEALKTWYWKRYWRNQAKKNKQELRRDTAPE